MTISRNLSFLAEGASSTGVLSVSNGGTGLTSLTAGYVPYGNGTSAFSSSGNLYFDGSNLGIGTGPITLGNKLTVNQTAAAGAIALFTPTGLSGFTSVITSQSVTAAGTGWLHFLGQSNSGSTNNIFIYGNGNIVNTNNSYGTLSDAKIKENIVDATPKLDDVMKLKVRNFNLINDYEKLKQIGFIAQELEEVFPGLIEENEDFEQINVPSVDENGKPIIDKDGNPVMEKQKKLLGTYTKSIKSSVLVPILVKTIQELNNKFDAYVASHP